MSVAFGTLQPLLLGDVLTDQLRIEDNILITKNGTENLTTTIKDPDEMEKLISSS